MSTVYQGRTTTGYHEEGRQGDAGNREVPNVLVLRPRGQVRVPHQALRTGADGLTVLEARWRVVELWTVPAEPVLATADPGMMPWVLLMQASKPPEAVLSWCREVIDRHAPAAEHD